jgi:hypothetical protein
MKAFGAATFRHKSTKLIIGTKQDVDLVALLLFLHSLSFISYLPAGKDGPQFWNGFTFCISTKVEKSTPGEKATGEAPTGTEPSHSAIKDGLVQKGARISGTVHKVGRRFPCLNLKEIMPKLPYPPESARLNCDRKCSQTTKSAH